MALTLTLFDIQRSSFVDGPGIRTTVFFKGCNLRCAWCHNPESQRAERELMLYRERCTGCGLCTAQCPSGRKDCTLCGTCELYCAAEARRICGKPYTQDEVMEELLADKPFYETSGGGVTFSGGECMLQLDALEQLLIRCRAAGIHTAVDTAGHVPFAAFARILPYVDLFLYDMKVMDAATHKRLVGVDNTLILQNLAALLAGGASVWVRTPMIAGVNDSKENALAMLDFFKRHGTPQRIELLPYHAMGEGKALALGRVPQRFAAPPRERLEALAALLPNCVVK